VVYLTEGCVGLPCCQFHQNKGRAFFDLALHAQPTAGSCGRPLLATSRSLEWRLIAALRPPATVLGTVFRVTPEVGEKKLKRAVQKLQDDFGREGEGS
jgi:hypothetical protein